MALRIRCQHCRKVIAIDEGFVGGICRCPYCRALSIVPARRDGAAPAEARPAAPDRPAAPTAAPQPGVPEAASAKDQPVKAVPVASPVVFQGVVAIVLCGLMLLLVAAAVVFFYLRSREQHSRYDYGPAPKNVFAAGGTKAAGMEFTPPVVFLLDGGSGMYGLFDAAGAVVRYSVRGMSPSQQFNLVLAREGRPETLSPQWASGGDNGDVPLKAFLNVRQCEGLSDLEAGIERALALRPKTIVVLTAKAVDNPAATAERARAAGVRILGIGIGEDAADTASLKQLAQATGGRYSHFTGANLESDLLDLEPLP